MEDEEYCQISTPIITSNDCEGAGDTFTVKSSTLDPFFDSEAHLTVSAQLHLEAMAAALHKVYTVSPAFRAENSQTRRHLAEFTMFEAEEYFLDSLDVLMDNVERLTKALTAHIVEKCSRDLDFLRKANGNYQDCERLLSKKYLR